VSQMPSRPLRLRSLAAVDLEEIVRYLDGQSTTAADDFLNEFFKSATRLAEMPGLGPVRCKPPSIIPLDPRTNFESSRRIIFPRFDRLTAVRPDERNGRKATLPRPIPVPSPSRPADAINIDSHPAGVSPLPQDRGNHDPLAAPVRACRCYCPNREDRRPSVDRHENGLAPTDPAFASLIECSPLPSTPLSSTLCVYDGPG